MTVRIGSGGGVHAGVGGVLSYDNTSLEGANTTIGAGGWVAIPPTPVSPPVGGSAYIEGDSSGVTGGGAKGEAGIGGQIGIQASNSCTGCAKIGWPYIGPPVALATALATKRAADCVVEEMKKLLILLGELGD